MRSLIDRPLVLFVVAFVGMWLASVVGVWLRKRQPHGDDKRSEDFGIVVAETLTLLALIIGFTFSMATNRYDQRKGFEEAEANAIETEFLRADLLPPSAAAPVRTLLVAYLEQRIAFYNNDDQRQRDQINRRTDQLQSWLWTAVRPAASRDTPVTALALAGMNDVINSRGHTRAALWNRIPTAAWGLMAAIAVCGNVLLGFGSRSGRPAGPLSFVLPLTVSISFLLIADIDAPRHGLIRVSPENLSSLAQSLGR